jgi:hypothetical protein
VILSALKLTNGQGSVLNLPLGDPSNGYVVKNIDGLGPVKATLVSSSFANMDGEQYHSARRSARNIVISLVLEPDYGVMDAKTLRDMLYRFVMPKSSVKVTFTLFDQFSISIVEQTLELEIMARVESCEPPLFAREPTIDISLMCFDPDLVDPRLIDYVGTTTSDLTMRSIDYVGTVDAGVLFTFRPNRPVNEFTIYHQPPDQTLHTIEFAYPLLTDDVVAISSVPGSKFARLVRDGVESSVLFAISSQSDWFTLQPGSNAFRVYATGDPVPFDIEYTVKYGGL